jgi:MarR family transcriptional regulator for hemolysin
MDRVRSYQMSLLLTRAYRILRAEVYRCLDEYELNPTQWSLLGLVVEARDGIRQSEVASALGVKAPLVTMLVDKLAARELMVRIPNPVDTRSKLLVITPRGKTLVKTIETALVGHLLPLVEEVSEENMQAFRMVLGTIVKNEHN